MNSHSTILTPKLMRFLLILTAAVVLNSCATPEKNAVVVTESTTLQQFTLSDNTAPHFCALYYTTMLKTDSLSGDTLFRETKARLNWFAAGNTAAQQSCELESDSIPVQVFGWFGDLIYFRNKLNEPFALDAKTGKVTKKGNAVFGITDTSKTLVNYRFLAAENSFLLTYSSGERKLFNANSGKQQQAFSPKIMKSWCERFGTQETTSATVSLDKQQYLSFDVRDSMSLHQVLLVRNYRGSKNGKPDTLSKTTNWLNAAFLNLTDSCDTPVITSEKTVIVLHQKTVQHKAELITCIDKKGKTIWSADLEKVCDKNYQLVCGNNLLACAYEKGVTLIELKDGKTTKVNFIATVAASKKPVK
jgi:hypothetical protein